MSPRRTAFFDVGTNTILCLIAEIRDTGRFRVLDDLAEITRLGEGVDRTGVISPEGERRSLEVLKRYRDHCKKLGVDIRVISGDEEAAYSFLAAQRGLSLFGKGLLVIDVGGGSTELIRGNENGVCQAISIDLGSVRLTERYLPGDPVRREEVLHMTEALDRDLSSLMEHGMRASARVTLVGIAATFTTLAAIEKKLAQYSHSQVHGSILTLDEIRRQIRLLQEQTIAERKRIVGLEPKRADVIFAGACLIERIMTFWHADRVIVSDQGVRYGLLHEAARLL